MRKYICSICGYVYDEAVGKPKEGIAPGTKWEDIPANWICPLCGATKADFTEQKISSQPIAEVLSVFEHEPGDMRELSFGEVSALCSNLSKGCEKQYRLEEADLFNQLAEFYQRKINISGDGGLKDIEELIQQNLNSGYVDANIIATYTGDRGALRSLVWGEKVTRMLNSLISRYEKQQDSLLENTNVYLCEICGFVYIGDEVPENCPVCKVPNMKLTEIKRG